MIKELYRMAHPLDFIGQRADKVSVEPVLDSEDLETGERVVRTKGNTKRIEYYTVSCDECGADGYYDQRGEIICDGCGAVLSGDTQAAIAYEYDGGNEREDGDGRSRGTSPQGVDVEGAREPVVDREYDR